MLTFAMDEYGYFEKSLGGGNSNPFVGGVLYDDNGNEKDYHNERKRIVQFYKEILESIHKETPNGPPMVFPNALHVDGKGNNAAVGLFKERFRMSIEEFCAQGTYQGKELLNTKRTGKYYIFANQPD